MLEDCHTPFFVHGNELRLCQWLWGHAPLAGQTLLSVGGFTSVAWLRPAADRGRVRALRRLVVGHRTGTEERRQHRPYPVNRYRNACRGGSLRDPLLHARA